VSKFHSIWSTIAQESNLGRKGRILGENNIFHRPPTGQCPAQTDNVQRDPDKVRPSILSSRNHQSGKSRVPVRCSSTSKQVRAVAGQGNPWGGTRRSWGGCPLACGEEGGGIEWLGHTKRWLQAETAHAAQCCLRWLSSASCASVAAERAHGRDGE
jgi:hypothetical protein